VCYLGLVTKFANWTRKPYDCKIGSVFTMKSYVGIACSTDNEHTSLLMGPMLTLVFKADPHAHSFVFKGHACYHR